MGLGFSNTAQLSNDELELVRSSWKILMENSEENGVLIFKTLSDGRKKPSKYIRPFKNVPISELPKNKVFRKHAASIIQTFNNLTLHLGNDSLLKHDLSALGKMHRMRNVTEQQFEELKVVMLDILEKEFKLSSECLTAWNKALDIAFPHIFEGLQEGK